MKHFIAVLITAGLTVVPAALANTITVGLISLSPGTPGTQQFSLDNFTGVTSGCSFGGGTPGCTNLLISGTLSYSFILQGATTNGSATVSNLGPDSTNGGNSYTPLSFQFSSAANFLTATFTGTLSPVSFSIATDDVGGRATFNSNGIVVSSDVIAGGGFAALNTNSAVTAVPEPSSIGLFVLGGAALLTRIPRRRRA